MNNSGNAGLADKPKYAVYIPYEKLIQWPNKCSMCSNQPPTQMKTISASYKSGEYLVAEKNTKVTINNVPICNTCNQRTLPTKGESIVSTTGLVIGIIMAIIIIVWNWNFLCFGILIGAGVFLGTWFLGRTFLRKKSEAEPVELVLPEQIFIVGTQTARWMKFLFRNRDYAYLFAGANWDLSQYKCAKCGSPVLYNMETAKWYCLTCDM